MKTSILIFSAIFLTLNLNAQIKKEDKIQIALLGSMHFSPSTQDEYSNDKLNLTVQKQNEIEDVITKLTEYEPTQICIEVPASKQNKINEQFVNYLKGDYELKLNEIDLLGFQTAKRLQLKKLTCINYLGNFDTEPVKLKSVEYGQEKVLEMMHHYAKEFINEINQNSEHLTILENLVYLNSDSMLQKNLQMYTKFYASIGENNDYVGTELVSEWYKTNLHIYTNILRKVKSGDERILVIFGQGHIPILKHLFESNSNFEIVPIKEILK
ncbi:DUF5694 domain-containing protein [Aquimarina sp. ERC-38]|uniref:DUF5694 domain-containing protein n=1 Tax=Aquimarina sp. ERC-38 TaxID=2949996 RepID=UPI0022469403|nr:DUF5694 domain-containing protein [Aquimarina sp. ERC-38]UZO81330.1 DUF5694 domain-containing protein [Aquimarina sp. ERC-38]